MKGKLSVGSKLLYGAGTLTDSITANMFVFFFVFFLTNIAGIKPGMAGVISLVAVVWDAITDPIIGYVSDNITTKYGRRRPLILIAAVPIGIALWMMFTTVHFEETSKNIYYLLIAMFYYSAYTAYYIPYVALGSELSDDYNERTSIRFYCLGYQLIGVFVASSGTMMLVEHFSSLSNPESAWSTVAMIFGAIGTLGALFVWWSTRGKEDIRPIDKKEKISFIKTFKVALSLKSVRILSLVVLIYAIGFSITNGVLVFVMNDYMHLEHGSQAAFWTFFSLIGLVIIPISNMLGMKLGKKKGYVWMIAIVALIQMAFTAIPLSFVLLCVIAIFICLGHNTYFGLTQSMMYDCCEAYEFRTGLKKEGAVTSTVFLFQKVGYAVGMWLMGFVMELSGYDGTLEVQSSLAVTNIKLLLTMYAPALFILSVICMMFFKLDGAAFEALKDALKLKREGKVCDDEAFKKVI